MKKLVNETVRWISQKCFDVYSLAKLLMQPKYPSLSAAQAMSYLHSICPDLGKSCWMDSGAIREECECLLSVIVPVYNVENYIDGCLASVLGQQVTFDFEVIVVNDGSTDATADILQKYGHDKRVRIVHQRNGGLSAARNTGIACAKGKYLCFVDSDDQLSNDALEIMMSVAQQNDAKLVVAGYEKVSDNGKIQYVKQLKDQKTQDAILPGFAWGKLIHHDVFRTLRFPEGYWFEDSIMAQIVHPLCRESTYTVSHISYRYFSNQSGITATAKRNAKSIDSLWVSMRLLEERKQFGLSDTQASYDYFLSMVKLTYKRTKYLGAKTAQGIFAVQKMLLDRYYSDYQIENDREKRKIQVALQTNNFRKYVLACEKR